MQHIQQMQQMQQVARIAQNPRPELQEMTNYQRQQMHWLQPWENVPTVIPNQSTLQVSEANEKFGPDHARAAQFGVRGALLSLNSAVAEHGIQRQRDSGELRRLPINAKDQ